MYILTTIVWLHFIKVPSVWLTSLFIFQFSFFLPALFFLRYLSYFFMCAFFSCFLFWPPCPLTLQFFLQFNFCLLNDSPSLFHILLPPSFLLASSISFFCFILITSPSFLLLHLQSFSFFIHFSCSFPDFVHLIFLYFAFSFIISFFFFFTLFALTNFDSISWYPVS